MPQIKKIPIHRAGKDFELVISFNTKKEAFTFSGIPPEYTAEMKHRNFSTFDDCRRAVIAAIDAYTEKMKRTRKVILVTLSATHDVAMEKIGRGHYSLKPEADHRLQTITDGGWGFIIDYRIGLLVEGGVKDNQFYEIDEEGQREYADHVAKYEVILDWTEEREQFFLGIAKAVREMVEKVAAYLLDDPAKVMQRIDARQKLLN